MNLRTLRLTAAVLALAALAACATAPKPLQGEFAALAPADTRAGGQGTPVRWGGVIAAVEPRADQTCLQIVARELDANARPRDVDASSGRFIACRAGFYDPQVFAEGREITVVGRLDGSEVRMIGEYRYEHPRVAADIYFLWPERSERDWRHRDPWYPHPFPYRRHPWWW